MTRIKICGITNVEDAILSVRAGCDAIGFVFAPSPRQIGPDKARAIGCALPPFTGKVGVFTNQSKGDITEIISYCGLSAIQIYNSKYNCNESEFRVPIIKAFRAKDENVLDEIAMEQCGYFLIDTYVENQEGGTGRTFDWEIARKASSLGDLILAGGLNHDNVVEALEKVRPYAVDVSSGVEMEPGVKDPRKVQMFIDEVRKWDNRTN